MNAMLTKGSPRNPAPASKAAWLMMLIITLATGVLAVAPFFYSRYEMSFGDNGAVRLPKTHDIENLLPAMQQFDKGIRSGVIYPRWFADVNLGYGAATGNFYPPGIFYVGSLFHAVTNDWVDTLFLICALGLMGSGLALYRLARVFYGKLASAASAVLYMLLPYHMIDLYWRGAIPEFIGFVFMPIILYYAYRLGATGRARYVAAVGLSHGLYLMTHLPVGYLFTYVLAFYALVWAAGERDFKVARRIATGIALALVVSAIYWLPAALEGKYVYEWASEIFPYHQAYLTLLPTQDFFTQFVNDSFTLLMITLLAAVLVFRAAPRPAAPMDEPGPAGEEVRKRARSYSQTRNWIILGFAAAFMSTSFSIYISRLIPKIQVAVPPFRWLAIASVFVSLSVAAVIDYLREPLGKASAWVWVYRAAIAAAIILNIWTTAGVMRGALTNPTYTPAASYVDSGFTPKDSTRPNNLPDTASVVIEPEGGLSETLRWDPQHRQVRVKVGEASTVRLKTYNFTGWTARIDGNPAQLESDKDGAQIISVPAGMHVIETSFENTPPRMIGATATIIGLLLAFGLAVSDQLRRSRRGVETEEQAAGDERGRPAENPARRAGAKGLLAGNMKKVGVISIAIIISIVFALMMARRSGPGGDSGPASSQAGGVPPGGRGPITTGSDARLYVEGLDSIPIASDESALGELMTALSSKDGSRVDALAESG
ncbi:MAG TPA: 6-pyruvoyl-tetrahydropterin synthase-related protein, partial [Blastocatellia bacterium]